MFTPGRIVFTLLFIVAFVAVMIWAYRKDMKQVRQWFPRPWIILLALLAILVGYILFTKAL
jgi:cbb3-type cytochrome oxidase subunit 3